MPKDPTHRTPKMLPKRKRQVAKRSSSPTIKREEPQSVFADPRCHGDRRVRTDLIAVPESGCRRQLDRRSALYGKNDEWWMKRGYSS